MNFKYILNLKVKFKTFGDMYYDDDIFMKIYNTYKEARSIGLEKIKESMNRYRKAFNLKIDDIKINEDIFIDFRIIKITTDTNSCPYNINNNKNDKEKIKTLQNYLYSETGSIYIILDHTGYPGLVTIKEGFADDLFCPKSFEYNKKYHLDKFKIGDKVRVKVPFEKEKIYEIFDIINKDKSIYNSDDPLHFRQGYALTDIYNEYCNKYTQLHFDEDLIQSSDEEYYNFYKSWDWYDNENNILGTYGEYNKD